MFTHSDASGRSYVSIRSSNPDPAREFVVTVSDGFYTGPDGLRDLAKAIKSFADAVDPKPKPKVKGAASEGGAK